MIYFMIFLSQFLSKNKMGKYDDQTYPAIIFFHIIILRYKKSKHNLIIINLSIKNNSHLININHIILYIYIIFLLLYTQSPFYIIRNFYGNTLFVTRDIYPDMGGIRIILMEKYCIKLYQGHIPQFHNIWGKLMVYWYILAV